MTTYTLNPNVKKFPGGEVFPRPETTDDFTHFNDTTIVKARLTSSDDIMALLMLCDALQREGRFTRHRTILKIPYFPYARQDRVANKGESLSAAVMAGLINGLGFDEVHILDLHSDITSALIKNVRVTHAFEPVWNHFENKQIYEGGIFVIPDDGAEKKTLAFAKVFGNTRKPLRATKNRCTVTGKITETVLHDNGEKYEGPQDFVVVDDICDGGRTFIELAKVIRGKYEVKSLHLHVSHGIFSRGLNVLFDRYSSISTTDSFPQPDNRLHEVLPAL